VSARRVTPERWLFSCEHGGRELPPEYAPLFATAAEVLDSHRAWDPGSLEVCSALAGGLADAAYPATTTRLLVDLNRSLHHPKLFSEFTRGLPAAAREALVARWWRPWREAVADRIAGWRSAGDAVRHFSVHSFTPVLDGRVRNADIGLLYDPARPSELEFCRALQALLAARDWRVRLNYPYRGVTDGHTTALRRRFGEGYAGIELEFNQALFPRLLEPLCADLGAALAVLRR
jgi:predicted N-formylglutamate amidohydrolase